MYHYGIKDKNDPRLYHFDDEHPTGDWVGCLMINPGDMEVGKEYLSTGPIPELHLFMETKIKVKTPWPRDRIALFMYIKRRV
jgi:hypothetical protein